MNTSVIEAIERQKTTNLYDASKSIPDDEIRELVRLATFSPTAFHLQNWRFIAVRSPEAKARLRAVAADQPKVTEAAVTFIMVGELAVEVRRTLPVSARSEGLELPEGTKVRTAPVRPSHGPSRRLMFFAL